VLLALGLLAEEALEEIVAEEVAKRPLKRGRHLAARPLGWAGLLRGRDVHDRRLDRLGYVNEGVLQALQHTPAVLRPRRRGDRQKTQEYADGPQPVPDPNLPMSFHAASSRNE
jgi:hypothetical protein